jgi:hypothetical protein
VAYLVWWVLAGKASELQEGPEQLGVGRPAARSPREARSGAAYSSASRARRGQPPVNAGQQILPWLLGPISLFLFLLLRTTSIIFLFFLEKV